MEIGWTFSAESGAARSPTAFEVKGNTSHDMFNRDPTLSKTAYRLHGISTGSAQPPAMITISLRSCTTNHEKRSELWEKSGKSR